MDLDQAGVQQRRAQLFGEQRQSRRAAANGVSHLAGQRINAKATAHQGQGVIARQRLQRQPLYRTKLQRYRLGTSVWVRAVALLWDSGSRMALL